jgi:hypothetical protein
MTAQERALASIAAFLTASRTPFMIVGGIANIVWGEPRATLDIDVTVWVDDRDIDAFVARSAEAFEVLAEDAPAFVRRTRVLPLQTADGVRVDVIFGLLPFEREAIARARPVTLAGTPVPVCSPEDLILMKIVSDRERDLRDAERLIALQWDDLDRAYLEPRIEELAVLLGDPRIRDRWTSWSRT